MPCKSVDDKNSSVEASPHYSAVENRKYRKCSLHVVICESAPAWRTALSVLSMNKLGSRAFLERRGLQPLAVAKVNVSLDAEIVLNRRHRKSSGRQR